MVRTAIPDHDHVAPEMLLQIPQILHDLLGGVEPVGLRGEG